MPLPDICHLAAIAESATVPLPSPALQFTGETPVQGVPPKGSEDDPEYDKNCTTLQLYAGAAPMPRPPLK